MIRLKAYQNEQSPSRSASYGIDGPVVLRNLIIVGMVAAGIGVLAHYQILPIRHSLASTIAKFCLFIIVFNTPSACGGVDTWKRVLGGTTCPPKYKLDSIPL